MVITVTKIDQPDDTNLVFTFNDGEEKTISIYDLRCACRCASCVSETTGEKILDIESIPKELGIAHADLVGNYALEFHFTDGHKTGIYSFERLREI